MNGALLTDLAACRGLDPVEMSKLLETSAEDGIVECVGGESWRLTARAERQFGAALRAMADEEPAGAEGPYIEGAPFKYPAAHTESLKQNKMRRRTNRPLREAA